MRFRDRFAEAAAAFDAVLFGGILALARADKKVHDKMGRDAPELYDNDDRLEHSLDDLYGALSVSLKRLERIEDKATKTVIGVGVALAIIGSASTILGRNSTEAAYGIGAWVAAAIPLTAATVFLLLSGYLALRAYAVGEVYRPTLRDAVPLVPEREAKKVLLHCIEQNQRIGTIRGNFLSASFACLRNGLVLVAVLGVLLVVSSFSEGPNGRRCKPCIVQETAESHRPLQ
jgi:hypothetical protein